MKRRSFDEIIELDQAIYQLASYEVSHGLIDIIKTQQESMAIQIKVARKFNYFKDLIRNHGMSLEFIKNTVLNKNGPFPQKEFKVDNMDEWLKDQNSIENSDAENYTEAINNLDNILRQVLDTPNNSDNIDQIYPSLPQEPEIFPNNDNNDNNDNDNNNDNNDNDNHEKSTNID